MYGSCWRKFPAGRNFLLPLKFCLSADQARPESSNFLFCLSARKKFSFPPLGQKNKFFSAFQPENSQFFHFCLSARKKFPPQILSGLAPCFQATPGSSSLLLECKFRMEISCTSTAPRWPPSTCVRIFPSNLRRNCDGSSLAPPLVKAGQKPKFRVLSLGVPSPGDSWTG